MYGRTDGTATIYDSISTVQSRCNGVKMCKYLKYVFENIMRMPTIKCAIYIEPAGPVDQLKQRLGQTYNNIQGQKNAFILH